VGSMASILFRTLCDMLDCSNYLHFSPSIRPHRHPLRRTRFPHFPLDTRLRPTRTVIGTAIA
jgi:hypothetical protein